MTKRNVVLRSITALAIGAALGWATGAIISSAHADTSPLSGHTPLEYCNLVADYGEAAAKNRDSGVSVLTALALASEVTTLHVRIDFVTTTYLIHATPHKSPAELAGHIFELCYATYGGAQ